MMREKEPITMSRRTFVDGMFSLTGAFLLQSGGVATAQTASDEQAGRENAGLTNIPAITDDAKRKFDPQGHVLPFAGNTVICHVQPQGAFRDALVRLYKALEVSPLRRKIALLPPDSYHMTVYSGANDQARKLSGWPGGVSMDVPIEECSRVLLERLRDFELHCELPLRVKLKSEETTSTAPCSLRVAGVDDASERNLRAVRKQLGKLYQVTIPDPDTYGFHISVAYTVEILSEDEVREYHRLLRPEIENLVKAAPVIELGIPEFCTFPDMYTYDVRRYMRVRS